MFADSRKNQSKLLVTAGRSQPKNEFACSGKASA